MKKSMITRLTALFLAVLCCFGVSGIAVAADSDESGSLKDTSTSTSKEEMEAYLDAKSYRVYYERYAGEAPGASIDVDVAAAFRAHAGVNAAIVSQSAICNSGDNNWRNWPGMTEELANSSVYLPNSGAVDFEINVATSGMYYIQFKYYTLAGTVNAIQRSLLIDGSVPFSEASYLQFSKVWEYDYKVDSEGNKQFEQDLNKNDIQPSLGQVQTWRTYACSDSNGYVNGCFAFYLTAGSHTLTLDAQREAFVLGDIKLLPADDETYTGISYDKYVERMETLYGATEVGKKAPTTKIEAEKPVFVSDPSVYMGSDRTSPINSPSSAKSQLFNVIGQTSFSSVGQWAAYSFTVKESGFYNIAMRFQQSALQGMFLCRTIRLWSENRDADAGVVYGLEDGTPLVPFNEAYNTRFDFSKKWQSEAIGDGEDEFLFYFDKDVTYTVYIEVGLGSLAEAIEAVERSLSVINDSYLNIIRLTGASPDQYRDYNFSTIMPDVIYNLNAEAVNLAEIAEYFEEVCGTNGSHIATLVTISNLLATMGKDEMNIAKNLQQLKTYLGTLGTWINDSKSSLMTIDLLSIQSPEAKLPKAKANIFQAIGFEIKAFFMSFITDYDNMGVTNKDSLGDGALNVWLDSGRDQSKIWRTLVDSNFSGKTGIPVSLKLVTAPTLLPSVLAGKGPDVYLGLESSVVINYAIRDAIMPISPSPITGDMSAKEKQAQEEHNEIFGDFASAVYGVDEIAGTDDDVYHKAALDTVTLLNKTYGLPLTMSFPMMFYRLDVLVELGVDVPETWDDLLELQNVLQSNYLQIGLTYALALNFFLYQNGGSMWRYEDNPEYAGAAIGLDTNEALEAFEYCCRFYTDYGFPVAFDAANRFRTGEMPLVIADYVTTYNMLVVFATEIRGLWEFSSIPGTLDENGKLNYDSIASVTATVMLHGCDKKEEAWQFMQWQTGADAESEFGNRMVALLGPSAKYAAANLGAIEKLSWTTKENAAIQDQLNHLASIVNYPGSYIITRYTQFAFLAAVNSGANPQDAIMDYIETINAELTRKREEFGLNTLKPGQTPEEAEAEAAGK